MTDRYYALCCMPCQNQAHVDKHETKVDSRNIVSTNKGGKAPFSARVKLYPFSGKKFSN